MSIVIWKMHMANVAFKDMVIVMADMNARVGSEGDPLKMIVGGHGFGERNERGYLLVGLKVGSFNRMNAGSHPK